MKKLLSIALSIALMLCVMPLGALSVAAYSDFDGGSGTEEDPYLIANIDQLDNVRYYMDAHFKLTCDLDLTEAVAEGGIYDVEGRGWAPIGGESTHYFTEFTGSFDGDGHTISGLRVNIPTGYNSSHSIYAGLFAYNIGTIQGLSVEGVVSVQRNQSVYVYVGGIAGYNKGIIEQCHNAATVQGVTSYYTSYVGGVCGYTDGGTIRNCYNTGNIHAKQTSSSSYAYYAYAGGIAGYYNSSSDSSITLCYNAGAITAENARASYYAYRYAITYNDNYTNCYYLQGTGNAGKGAVSLIEAQMRKAAAFRGFDFDTVWTMAGEGAYLYPELQVFTQACSTNGHSYESATTDPDCENDGYTTYTCSVCGDTYTETIAALGHNYESATTDPDCENDGYTTYTCSNCGDTYTETIAALGHTPGAEADCENDQVCTLCGDVLVNALGHNYESATTDPDCENDGYTTYTCSNCGDTYTETIAALGHNYEAVVTDPDCENDGYTTHTCSNCGDTYTTDPTAALDHAYADDCDRDCNTCGTVRFAPHCYDGACDEFCNACGAKRKAEAHSYDHDCDAECNVCGAIREVGDHVYSDACDGDCNHCGVHREPPHIYDNACDDWCDGCGFVREVGDHVYDDERDASCNVCGALRDLPGGKTGDVNGDDNINNRDLAMLQQYLNDWDVIVNKTACDLNGDGDVNNRDLAMLQQYLNGWDIKLA